MAAEGRLTITCFFCRHPESLLVLIPNPTSPAASPGAQMVTAATGRNTLHGPHCQSGHLRGSWLVMCTSMELPLGQPCWQGCGLTTTWHRCLTVLTLSSFSAATIVQLTLGPQPVSSHLTCGHPSSTYTVSTVEGCELPSAVGCGTMGWLGWCRWACCSVRSRLTSMQALPAKAHLVMEAAMTQACWPAQ